MVYCQSPTFKNIEFRLALCRLNPGRCYIYLDKRLEFRAVVGPEYVLAAHPQRRGLFYKFCPEGVAGPNVRNLLRQVFGKILARKSLAHKTVGAPGGNPQHILEVHVVRRVNNGGVFRQPRLIQPSPLLFVPFGQFGA